MLSRFRQQSGESFGAHKTIKGPDGNDRYVDNRGSKPTGPKGKLRLRRTGATIQYLVAEEGPGFKNIMSVEIGTGDVQTLDVDCHTMYTPIALDVRLTELVLDADDFPDGMPSAEDPAAPAADPAASTWLPQQKGLLTAVILSVMTVFCLGGVGVWLLTRERNKTRKAALAFPRGKMEPEQVTPPLLGFVCAACGKKLRINGDLAGKKVKCPACSEVIRVPGGKRSEQITDHP
jgi:hypothetical protein